MTSRNRLPRAGAALAFASALLTAATLTAEPLPGPLAFVEGGWTGRWMAISKVAARNVGGRGTFKGTLRLVAQGGEVKGGWEGKGVGEVEVPRGQGKSTYVFEGKIEGRSDRPRLSTTSASMHIDMIVAGVRHRQTMPILSKEDPASVELEIKSATCTQVTGRWTVRSGQVMSGEGLFAAFRTDDSADANAFSEVLDAFLERAKLFWLAGLAGNVNVDQLDSLRGEAGRLDALAARNTACGLPARGVFDAALREIVADLLRFSIRDPGAISARELAFLLMAARQLGVLGPGAADPKGAAEFVKQLVYSAEDRLQTAAQNKDCVAIGFLGSAADVLGYEPLRNQVRDLRARACAG